MISVPIDRIVPLTDARDNFSRLVNDVESISDGLYVLTKGGKPAIALISIKYLEEIMGNATNNESRITNHELIHKTHRDILPKPEASNQKPEAILPPKPSFEVPKIPSSPAPFSSPLEMSQKPIDPTPVPKPVDSAPVLKPEASSQKLEASYDVKPVVNPTWRGEEPAEKPLAPSSLAPSQNQPPVSVFASAPLPEASSQKPEAILPAAAIKPSINPWPIIPPRQELGTRNSELDGKLVPNPQSPVPTTAQSPVPDKPRSPETSPSPQLVPSPQAPPRMVAPPPPPRPSSLPNIPSSFQTVPVPVNGGKQELGTRSLELDRKPVPSPQSLETSPSPQPVPSTQLPVPSMSLPPPPVTTAPAPFSVSTTPPPPSAPAPLPVAPIKSDTITFDQPPTTITEPDEKVADQKLDNGSPSTGLPSTELGVNGVGGVNNEPKTVTPAPAAPPQTQASVQDLEI